MRILQVATLVTPDGAYGGPIRVAINQTRALLEAGHDVTFAAGASGFGKNLPDTFDGVPVSLFPASKVISSMGFAALIAPRLQQRLRSELSSYDALHLHLARDLVTLPVASLARQKKIPYVVQTHGMIVHSNHFLARPLDNLWTKKALLGAKSVLHLTAAERAGIETVSPHIARFEELHNGVPTQPVFPLQQKRDVEVLFMARLHAVKRPDQFVRMAINLHAKFPHVRFCLVGPDEGEGKKVQKLIDESGMGNKLVWEGALNPSQTLERMARATIYVLPSERDAFPMSVLEAMSLGIPVVVTTGCGLSSHVQRSNSGAVSDDSFESLISVLTPMLEDHKYTDKLGRNARNAARETFGMAAVVSRLETLYTRAITEGSSV